MNFLGRQSCFLRLRSNITRFVREKHTLPELPYDYGALEPVISADILHVHHQKHHATYVNNLNVAEEKTAEALSKGDLKAALSFQSALKFNAGGHINHSIYWTNLAKNGGEPSSELMKAINKDFGSFDVFRDRLTVASIGVQGSGWGWLGYNKIDDRLQIATTFNQDILEHTHGLIPLLTIDVWEHAYYLQYKNVRPDYVKAIWKIVNWNNVDERYKNAKR